MRLTTQDYCYDRVPGKYVSRAMLPPERATSISAIDDCEDTISLM
jgi:hypothetical protein